MISVGAAVQRGDSRFPDLIMDAFDRANSSDLGRTPVGNVPWKEFAGDWGVSGRRIAAASPGPNPLAVVNARFSDVDASVDVSPDSGDSLVIRATDERNFIRIGAFYDQSVEISYEDEYHWVATYGNPDSSTYTEYEWRAEFGGYAIPGWHKHPDPGDPVAAQSGPIVKTMWSSSNSSCPIPTNYPGHPSWRPGAPHSHLIYGDDFTEPNVMNTHKHTQTSCATTGATRQRTYSPPAHTHSRDAWSSSSLTSPLPTSLTHSHGIGTHTHPRASTSSDSTRSVESGRSTTTTRQIVAEEVRDGVATVLKTWVVGPYGRLRATALGDRISVYRGEDEFIETVVSLFNQNATFHGVGRRSGGIQGTALKNFSLARFVGP